MMVDLEGKRGNGNEKEKERKERKKEKKKERKKERKKGRELATRRALCLKDNTVI